MVRAAPGGHACDMTRLPRLALALVLSIGLLGSLPGPSDALTSGGWLRFSDLGASGRVEMTGSVFNWGCRGGELGGRVYRWGCAGSNNRYLMGHAYASFEPLHDFVRARGVTAGTRALVGKTIVLRTPEGTIRRYEVTWAKVASVAYWGRTGHTWAWGPTTRPSITFQTCFGSRSEYRLIVRAVLVG